MYFMYLDFFMFFIFDFFIRFVLIRFAYIQNDLKCPNVQNEEVKIKLSINVVPLTVNLN